jgi:hypothetical protein
MGGAYWEVLLDGWCLLTVNSHWPLASCPIRFTSLARTTFLCHPPNLVYDRPKKLVGSDEAYLERIYRSEYARGFFEPGPIGHVWASWQALGGQERA